MLNPDRIMLLCFNLGKLIESPDVDEKELGLTLSLFFLHHHPDIVICDILTSDQVLARDTILKRQNMIIFDCLKQVDQINLERANSSTPRRTDQDEKPGARSLDFPSQGHSQSSLRKSSKLESLSSDRLETEIAKMINR